MNCCGGSDEIDDRFGSWAVGVQRSGGRQRRGEVNRKSVALSCDGGGASITEGKTGSVYCGHSRLLEWRLVIESIADEVAGGAQSSGRAVVQFARV
ncbi:hypothetical protein M0R45_032573 [Rubus argutus]|uniref:Uncharacterized protein n=1 Tax=Rubus argutus TaxID=59490 RepID=A0AAW1WK75_RUBAR